MWFLSKERGSIPLLATMTKDQLIKRKLDNISSEIESYEPPTKWEAANNRMIKSMVKYANSLEYALERRKKRYELSRFTKKIHE